jgi:selenocysteine lyase/cysteine desulfurase
VTYLPVGSDGRIDLGQLADSLRPDTALVSIMAVNNEIGVRQPLAEIGALCRERKVFFHTDAAQVIFCISSHLAVSLRYAGIDFIVTCTHHMCCCCMMVECVCFHELMSILAQCLAATFCYLLTRQALLLLIPLVL